jgi:glutathionylspermidine synthase
LTSSYQEKRSHFYRDIKRFWADLYGEEYALFDMHLLSEAEVNQIRLVSNRVGHIFFKVCRLLREVPDETLLEMGFPHETLSFLRIKTHQAESVISRLDLIPTSDGYKCIEINADTPTFIKELFAVNGEVCRAFSVENPNDKMEERIRQAVRNSIMEGVEGKGLITPNIVFTAHDDHVEDRETVLYLQQLSGLPSKFTPLHQLQIQKGIGLFDEEGQRIDVLYRQTFPVENFISDRDENGNPIGEWLLELVERGKLVFINPPSAFLLQNKAVQAVIWGLHEEEHSFFTIEEHQWIEEYFLPTYLEEEPFLQTGQSYVKKPSFGREGDTVEIFKSSGQLAHANTERNYTNYVPVYQKYVESQTVRFQSEKGIQKGKLLIGSFLLNGKSAALGCRVGGEITNNLSYYLPVGVKGGN